MRKDGHRKLKGYIIAPPDPQRPSQYSARHLNEDRSNKTWPDLIYLYTPVT